MRHIGLISLDIEGVRYARRKSANIIQHTKHLQILSLVRYLQAPGKKPFLFCTLASFGETTEYPALLEAPLKKRWIRSEVRPPLPLRFCGGYAVKLDPPSP